MALIKNKVLKNITTLLGGTLLAQIIPLIASPLLSRIYSPEEFGEYSILLSIAIILSILFTFKLERAIIIPNSKQEANAISNAALKLIITYVIISLIIGLIYVVIFTTNIWVMLLPLILSTLISISEIFYYILSRNEKYGIIGKGKFNNSALMITSQSVYGKLIPGNTGLILGHILGLCIQSIIFVTHAVKNRVFKLDLKTNTWQIVKKYNKFPLINTPHALFDALNQQGTIFLLGILYSSTLVGQYAFLLRVIRAPIAILGTTIGQVYYQELSKQINSNNIILPIIKKLIFTSMLIGIIPCSILFLFSKELFTFFFGYEWMKAGVYAEYLMPFIFFNFISSPLSMIPTLLNRQGTFALLSIFSNVSYFIIFYLGYYYWGFSNSLKIVSSVLSLYYIFMIYWIYKICRESDLLRTSGAVEQSSPS
jgi:O-antigen/teichoic acid export membrane protein